MDDKELAMFVAPKNFVMELFYAICGLYPNETRRNEAFIRCLRSPDSIKILATLIADIDVVKSVCDNELRNAQDKILAKHADRNRLACAALEAAITRIAGILE